MTLRIQIPERAGMMLELLDTCLADLDITDFQYGKTHLNEAWPIFTLQAESPTALMDLTRKLSASGIAWEEISEATDLVFRAIPLRGDLLQNPVFLRLDFYERAGALHDFLAQRIQGNATLCYFNYRNTGERIGRALIGLDFPSTFEREALLMTLPRQGDGYRLCDVVDESTMRRIIGL
jgi:threonine dehydratase